MHKQMKFDFRVLEAEGLGNVAPLVKCGSSMQEVLSLIPRVSKKIKNDGAICYHSAGRVETGGSLRSRSSLTSSEPAWAM